MIDKSGDLHASIMHTTSTSRSILKYHIFFLHPLKCALKKHMTFKAAHHQLNIKVDLDKMTSLNHGNFMFENKGHWDIFEP